MSTIISPWEEVIKRDFKIDIPSLLNTDNYILSCPYGIYYSLNYLNSNLRRFQYIWFESLSFFKAFLYQLPIFLITDMNNLSDGEISESLCQDFERTFGTIGTYEFILQIYKHSISSHLNSQEFGALKGSTEMFNFPDQNSQKKINMKIEWVNERRDLLTTPIAEIKVVRDQIKLDFNGTDAEFEKYFFHEIFMFDYVQTTYEQMIDINALNYASYTKLKDLSDIDPIGITMINSIMNEFAETADSKYLKDYITENYIN